MQNTVQIMLAGHQSSHDQSQLHGVDSVWPCWLPAQVFVQAAGLRRQGREALQNSASHGGGVPKIRDNGFD